MKGAFIVGVCVVYLTSGMPVMGQYKPVTNKPGTYQPGAYQPYQPGTGQYYVPTLASKDSSTSMQKYGSTVIVGPTGITNLPRYVSDDPPPNPLELKIESKHPLDGATAMSAYVSYREGQLVSSIQGLRREANEVPKYQNKVLTTGDRSE